MRKAAASTPGKDDKRRNVTCFDGVTPGGLNPFKNTLRIDSYDAVHRGGKGIDFPQSKTMTYAALGMWRKVRNHSSAVKRHTAAIIQACGGDGCSGSSCGIVRVLARRTAKRFFGFVGHSGSYDIDGFGGA
jgi:hypothetical protein